MYKLEIFLGTLLCFVYKHVVVVKFVFGGRGGGSNLSDKGLNLSGSWQQGHSATYNTPSRI